MSFMSVSALDRLLEPSEIESTSSVQAWTARAERRSVVNISPLSPSHPHFQPSPPQTRIFSSSPSYSPSPHVLNFKQRVLDGSAEATSYVSMQPAGQLREATSSVRGESNSDEKGALPVRDGPDRLGLVGNSLERHERVRVRTIDLLMQNAVARSVESKGDELRQREFGREVKTPWRIRTGSSRQRDGFISSPSREEFFDASEEPFDDSTSDEESIQAQRTVRLKSPGRHADGNLKSLLDHEIKRRMAAEDAMAVLQVQCTEMASNLASVEEECRGLKNGGHNGGDNGGADGGRNSGQADLDSDFEAQRLVVAQVVAYSVARGAARAEVDEKMENVVVEKNREITRLRDKLQYFELVNHEMSQHNQEAFELARTKRHVRRNRNQWIMVCAGGAICVGVSAVLVLKFAPWASTQLRARGILQPRIQTDVYDSAPSCDT